MGAFSADGEGRTQVMTGGYLEDRLICAVVDGEVDFYYGDFDGTDDAVAANV